MTLAIVDYGMGNLFSVRRAAEICGAEHVVIASTPESILNADRLVLPGVGAFKNGIDGLRNADLIEPIKQFSATGKPMLGICLGAQLLTTYSHEFGHSLGLNLIPGNVSAIEVKAESNLKLPVIGWSAISIQKTHTEWEKSCLRIVNTNDAVYFVHSYHVLPDKTSDLLATYDYGGIKITAAIKRDNITGVQFHPEKSGQVGLSILQRFILE